MTRKLFPTQLVNPSYLSDAKNWPEWTDCQQEDRETTPEDRDLVRQAGEQVDFTNREFLRRFPTSGDRADRICQILVSQQINFNGGGVKRQIAGVIRAASDENQPIQIVMPCFCKINNTAKLMFSLVPTAAEEVSLRHLAHLSRSLRAWYPPGVHFKLVTDARLYATYLRNPAPTVTAYNQGLRRLQSLVAPEGEIELIEYDWLIAPHAREFEAAYAQALSTLEKNDSSILLGLDRQAIRESIHNNISTRSLEMTYDDLRECFGPARNPNNRYFALLEQMTDESLKLRLAIRAASRALETSVFKQAFGANYVRASIHEPYGDVRTLGLRIYPDYKRLSDVLPYHGVPLLYRDKDKVKMLVAPETRFYGNPKLVRVTHDNGETYFYRHVDG